MPAGEEDLWQVPSIQKDGLSATELGGPLDVLTPLVMREGSLQHDVLVYPDLPPERRVDAALGLAAQNRIGILQLNASGGGCDAALVCGVAEDGECEVCAGRHAPVELGREHVPCERCLLERKLR